MLEEKMTTEQKEWFNKGAKQERSFYENRGHTLLNELQAYLEGINFIAPGSGEVDGFEKCLKIVADRIGSSGDLFGIK